MGLPVGSVSIVYNQKMILWIQLLYQMYQLSEKLLEHIDHFKEKETRKNDADLFFFLCAIIKTNLVDLFEL